MSSSYFDVNEILLPADVSKIVEKYEHILGVYSKIAERDPIFPEYKRTRNLLSALFPLKEHPFHGVTELYAMERYDKNDYI